MNTNTNTELQILIAEVAKNRIMSGNYDKEIMLKNIGVLLADTQIDAEQYKTLKLLMNPVSNVEIPSMNMDKPLEKPVEEHKVEEKKTENVVAEQSTQNVVVTNPELKVENATTSNTTAGATQTV